MAVRIILTTTLHSYFEIELLYLLSHGLLILKGRLYPSYTWYSVDRWSKVWDLNYLS